MIARFDALIQGLHTPVGNGLARRSPQGLSGVVAVRSQLTAGLLVSRWHRPAPFTVGLIAAAILRSSRLAKLIDMPLYAPPLPFDDSTWCMFSNVNDHRSSKGAPDVTPINQPAYSVSPRSSTAHATWRCLDTSALASDNAIRQVSPVLRQTKRISRCFQTSRFHMNGKSVDER